MQQPPIPVSEVELNAYVDGETFPERQGLIETWLAQTPADATRVETWRRQNQILKAAYARILSESVPPSIPTPLSQRQAAQARIAALVQESVEEEASGAPIRHIERVESARKDTRSRLVFVTVGSFIAGGAAACLAAVAFGLAPYPITPARNAGHVIETQIIADLNGSMAKRAIEAFTVFAEDPDTRGPENGEQVSRWLSRHLGPDAAIPELAGQGLTLESANLTPGDFASALFIVYRAANGQRLGLYLSRSPGDDTAVTYTEARGLGASATVRKGLGVAVVGKAPRKRLGQIGEAALATLPR